MRKSLQRASRNLLLMYAIRVCTVSSALIVPNLVLYVRHYGVSQDQFFWLETAFALALLVVQIPTGRFADHFGRKRSMQIGSLILPLAQLFYLCGEGFWAFIAAEILCAAGFAFLSGADEAIFYESLVFLKKSHLHSRLWGRAFLCGFLSMSLGNFVGGLLASNYPRAPFVLATMGFSLIGILTLFLEEPARKSSAVSVPKVSAFGAAKICLIEKRDVCWLMLYPAVFMISIQSLLWVYQSYFLLNEIDQSWHGGLLAAFNLAAGIISLYAFKIEKCLGQKLIILLPLLLVSLSMFALAMVQSLIFLPILFIQQCVRGLLPSVFSGYLNKVLPAHYRATALSLKSACELLYYALILQLTRISVLHGGVREAFLLHGIITLVVGATLVLLRFSGRSSCQVIK